MKKVSSTREAKARAVPRKLAVDPVTVSSNLRGLNRIVTVPLVLNGKVAADLPLWRPLALLPARAGRSVSPRTQRRAHVRRVGSGPASGAWEVSCLPEAAHVLGRLPLRLHSTSEVRVAISIKNRSTRRTVIPIQGSARDALPRRVQARPAFGRDDAREPAPASPPR